MKHTTQKVLSFALAMVLSCFSGLTVKAQAAAIGDVAVDVSGSSVVIGNGHISRKFSTAGDKLAPPRSSKSAPMRSSPPPRAVRNSSSV